MQSRLSIVERRRWVARRKSELATFAQVLCLTLSTPAPADTLLIGNKGEDTVSFVDRASGQDCARVSTGPAPHEIAVSPNGRQAAVVAYGGNTIDIFDIRSAKLVRRISIAPNAGPHGIVWLKRDRIVVASDRSNSVVLLNPANDSFQSISTGQRGSHMLAISPDQRRAYVSNILSGSVSVIDLENGRKEKDLRVGGNPEGIALTPDGRELWVGDDSAPVVKVVDLKSSQVTATMPTGGIAIRIVITANGKTAVTSNFNSGTLSLFDVQKRRLLKTISVSGSAKAMQVTTILAEHDRRVLIAETGDNRIAEVDLETGKVIRRYSAGRNGDGLAISREQCRTGK